MADYWVSKDKYYCKYCKIFIADDAPSRRMHENGLKHKGNYERFIRNLYKDGERKQREERVEANEMARINAAAHASLGLAPPVASTSTSTTKGAKGKGSSSSSKWDNYTTAEQLGVVSGEELDWSTAKSNEVNIGDWQRVSTTTATTTKGKRKAEEDEANVKEQEEEEEERRPSARGRYLKEKTAVLDDDDGYDPAKLGAIKVKQPKVDPDDTPKEEEEVKVTRGKWESVELKEEEPLSFERLTAPTGTNDAQSRDAQSATVKQEEEEEESKPSTAAAGTAFKKRKMHGANAIRKK